MDTKNITDYKHWFAGVSQNINKVLNFIEASSYTSNRHEHETTIFKNAAGI